MLFHMNIITKYFHSRNCNLKKYFKNYIDVSEVIKKILKEFLL